MMLFSGSALVRPEPPPAKSPRSIWFLGFFTSYLSRRLRAHTLRPARNLATCSHRLPKMLRLKLKRPTKSSAA